MTDQASAFSPPPMSLIALFAKFLRFGALAFGGPVTQIAMLRQALVEKEHWIDPARFNRLLAVMQILPGPEAHELCVHFGMIARGRIGGLLAGLGFMLPGLLLMMLAGWLYVSVISGSPGFGPMLLGIQIVVLAVILRAVIRIGQHVLEDRTLIMIAVGALIATMVGVPFWIPLVAGGLIYAMLDRPLYLVIVLASAGTLAIVLRIILAGAAPSVAANEPATVMALFVAGLKGGLLTFGGAYTAIPYVRADTVNRGWISDATFLDGIAIAGILPAPLVIFATFVGYVVGGPGGALAITAGMFLPAFAFSMIFFERLEAVVADPRLHRLLTGIAAAVVGIIAGTLIDIAQTTAGRVSQPIVALILLGAAFIAAWRLKGAWMTPVIIAFGGIAGWVLTP